MDYNSLTKTALLAELQKQKQETEQLRVAAQNAVNLANYFAFNLETIENLILKSPVGKGKFIKTFFFIVTNWKAIRDLIEQIVNQIKEWRDKIEEIKAQQQKPNEDNAG